MSSWSPPSRARVARIRDRLRTVYGVGARSDRTKMRAVGRALRTGSDELILTTSGYRGDAAIPALQRHAEGARAVAGARLEIVLDRRRAIERALRAAAPGDAVVVLGRGDLTEMTPDSRGVPLPFDDREVVREALRGL